MYKKMPEKDTRPFKKGDRVTFYEAWARATRTGTVSSVAKNGSWVEVVYNSGLLYPLRTRKPPEKLTKVEGNEDDPRIENTVPK